MSRDLAREGVLATALAEPVALLFKHSPICPVSNRAAEEIERFASDHPDVPVYRVDVVRDRADSQEIARVLAIRHESPQAILLKAGVPVWHGSHWEVTVEALEEATRQASA